jgi:aminopeptidase N
MQTYFERYQYQHPGPEQFFAVANEVSGQDLTWFFDSVYRSAAVFDYGVDRVTTLPAAQTANGFDNVVVVRRYGDGILPVDVRTTFADGTTRTEHWSGRETWRAYEYVTASKVVRVDVDPDRVLLLDVNYTNNSWVSQSRAEQAAHKWSLRWLTWVEELMLSYGFFN